MAPFSRIHATATEVSRPPEKAMPTRSPTGRDCKTLDMPSILLRPARTPRFVGAAARGRRDFAEADAIRKALDERGIAIEDAPGGTKWRRVR